MSSDIKQAKIFLSYANEDANRVIKLYQWLEDVGFQPWMNSQNILPGQDTALSIQKAIHDSDFFLTFLSRHSINERGQLQRQIKEALDIWQEMLLDDIYIIPIRLEDCEVPDNLRNFQCMDLLNDDNLSHLTKAIQFGLEKRQKVSGAETRGHNQQSLNYKYDIFLSYPCSKVTPLIEKWVEQFFLPLLHHSLEDALGRYPQIFSAQLDDKPIHDYIHRQYKLALTFSRCLIPIWSPSYFSLEWSRYECAMMLDRENHIGYGKTENSNRLLLPVVGCDGDSFPEFSRQVPKLIVNSYVTKAPAFETLPKYFDFEKLVRDWVQTEVAEAINHAPALKSEWLNSHIVPLQKPPRPKFMMPAI